MAQSKVMITGVNGLLGQWLLKALVGEDYIVLATGRGECRLPFHGEPSYKYLELDITDGQKVDELVTEEKPDIIVHAAAMTQPDTCELNQVQCWNSNVTATRFLIDAANKIGAFFVFISTDFVFAGDHGPYKEEDTPAPVNYYGSSKLAAEKALEGSALNWAIVRTVLVYGNTGSTGRTNLIGWVKNNLENKESIKVVSDQWRTPTYVEDLVGGIMLVMQKRATGIFHISGPDMLTPYQMAQRTAEFLKLDSALIQKVDASMFTQPAKRPPRTGFVIEKAKNVLGYEPLTFNQGLEKMLTETEEYAS